MDKLLEMIESVSAKINTNELTYYIPQSLYDDAETVPKMRKYFGDIKIIPYPNYVNDNCLIFNKDNIYVVPTKDGKGIKIIA